MDELSKLGYMPYRVFAEVEQGDKEGTAKVSGALVGKDVFVSLNRHVKTIRGSKETEEYRRRVRDMLENGSYISEVKARVFRAKEKGKGTLRLPEDWVGLKVLVEYHDPQ